MFWHLVVKDIPSQETIRQRLNQLVSTDCMPFVDSIVVALLQKASLGRISLYGTDYIPLDIAVLEDNTLNKEDVTMSCHKVKCDAPSFCNAGAQGFMVTNEMPPGSQHILRGQEV